MNKKSMVVSTPNKHTVETRKAVILALDPAYHKPVYGIPLLRRIVLLLSRAGVTDLCLITEDDPARIQNVLKKTDPSIRIVQAGRPEIGAAFSSTVSFNLDHDPVLVVWGHTVFDGTTIEALYALSHKAPAAIRAEMSSHRPENAIYLLPGYDAQELVEQITKKKDDPFLLLSQVPIYPASDSFPYIIGRSQKDIVRAEYLLARQLERETQPSDGFMARHFDRMISLAMSRRLAVTALTPNMITLCGAFIGLVGAWLFSYPSYYLQVVAAALFLFCIIIDGVDGEVARLKLEQSAFGYYLDITMDNVVHVAVFIGMAIGLGLRFNGRPYLGGLTILLVGFGMCAIAVYYCFHLKDRGLLAPGSLPDKLVEMIGNRDFAYLVLLLAVLDRLRWFFWGSVIGCIVFALLLFVLTRRAAIPDKR